MYVPGHKLDWALKAGKYGADGLILDLEDAVPDDKKDEARSSCREAIGFLRTSPMGLFVRINGWRTGQMLGDVLALAPSSPDGFFLPKVVGPNDVIAFDALLTELEHEHQLPIGEIEIVPICETAAGMRALYEVCMASTRIRRCTGGPRHNRGADSARALGIEWTEEGLEELYVNSRAILDAKAAGLVQIFGGGAGDIHNLDLLRRTALRARQFGCSGSIVLHPGQVSIINEIFSPSKEQITDAIQVLATMEEAIAKNSAAALDGGRMVDMAHVHTAWQLLSDAIAFGSDVTIPPYWVEHPPIGA